VTVMCLSCVFYVFLFFKSDCAVAFATQCEMNRMNCAVHNCILRPRASIIY